MIFLGINTIDLNLCSCKENLLNQWRVPLSVKNKTIIGT